MESDNLKEIENLEFYQDDETGWVYNHGKRVMRMYKHISPNGYGRATRVAFPRYKNVKLLEQLYIRLVSKYEEISNEWKSIFDAIVKAKIVIADCTLADCESGCFHKFVGHFDDRYGFAVTPYHHHKFNDNVDIFALSDTLSIGNAYMKTEKRLMQYGKYKNKVQTVLNAAIKEFYIEPVVDSGRMPTTFVFNINGREYTYTKNINDRDFVDYGNFWIDSDRYYEEIT